MFPRLGTITDRLTKGLKAQLNRINVVKLLESVSTPKAVVPMGHRPAPLGIMADQEHPDRFMIRRRQGSSAQHLRQPISTATAPERVSGSDGRRVRHAALVVVKNNEL